MHHELRDALRRSALARPNAWKHVETANVTRVRRVSEQRGARVSASIMNCADRFTALHIRRHRDLLYGAQRRQRLDAYVSVDGRAGLPVAVFLYGGAWCSGNKNAFAFVGRALARQGFMAVIPDLRLFPEVRFPAFVEDAAQVVKWIESHVTAFGGDPKQILVIGHSSGAHTGALLAYDQRYLEMANSSRRAIKGVVGLGRAYDFWPFPLKFCEEIFAGVEDPAMTQPISFARQDVPPSLLIAGSEDRHVPVENTLSLAAALTEVGARCKIYIEDRTAHLCSLLSFSNLPLSGSLASRRVVEFARVLELKV